MRFQMFEVELNRYRYRLFIGIELWRLENRGLRRWLEGNIVGMQISDIFDQI